MINRRFQLILLAATLVWTPAFAATITSVTFTGNASDPGIQISGSGFIQPPAASNLGYPGNIGNDYGKQLNIQKPSGPMSFSAGLDAPATSHHDYIGLNILSYSDTSIHLSLGSNYKSYYFPNRIYQLNEGDPYTVHVYDADFSGTVHYRQDISSASAAAPPSAPSVTPAPAGSSREDYQRALNQQVMSAPFNPGDVNKAQSYAVEAKQQGIEPVGVAPTYWLPGWTCASLISYAFYNFIDYRNCIYYHYYYGRYWP